MLVLDESHVTVPQIGGMYEGDMSRKRTLVEHGFRLPSAMDNRPLRWEEFLERIGQTVYLSATPGPYELSKVDDTVEQIIRPTGLVDPEVIVKATKGQIDDLIAEIQSAHRAQRAGARHHPDQEDVRGPHRLSPRDTASAPATCTARSTRCAGSSCSASCGSASTTCWSASTCSARASTCPRCRWWPSSTPTRRASSAPARRSSRPSAAPPETCPARSSCTPTGSPTRWRRRSTRPTGAGPSRSPTTRPPASTRSRCARRSPTSPTCSPARTPTPSSCSAVAAGARSSRRPAARRRRARDCRPASADWGARPISCRRRAALRAAAWRDDWTPDGQLAPVPAMHAAELRSCPQLSGAWPHATVVDADLAGRAKHEGSGSSATMSGGAYGGLRASYGGAIPDDEILRRAGSTTRSWPSCPGRAVRGDGHRGCRQVEGSIPSLRCRHHGSSPPGVGRPVPQAGNPGGRDLRSCQPACVHAPDFRRSAPMDVATWVWWTTIIVTSDLPAGRRLRHRPTTARAVDEGGLARAVGYIGRPSSSASASGSSPAPSTAPSSSRAG